MDYPIGTAVRLRETFTVAGVPTDPTAVTLHVLWPDGTQHDYVSPDVTNPAVGVYELILDSAGYAPGTYIYWAVGTGLVEATSLPRSFRIISVLAGDGQTGPCEAWITGEDVEPVCASSASSQDFQESADAASQILFQLVPRFSGTCGPRLVRPCSRPCSGPWIGWEWTGSAWLLPAGIMGTVLMGSGEPYPAARGCGCSPLSRVLLAGHVRDVLEVKIDGDVVDPATYRVDENRWLTRLPDPGDPDTRLFWPACQDMEADDSAVGTYSVSYTFGVDAPLPAKMAARELACAIFTTVENENGANSDECPLPNNVIKVQREGITLDLKSFTGWGFDATKGQWQTGMPLVDMFLNAYNPHGRRKRRARAWSPDLDKPAKRLG